MIQKIFESIYGTKSERDLKKLQPTVDKINSLEEEISKLTDEQFNSEQKDLIDCLYKN